MRLSQDSKTRKEQPVARGVLDYFPNALAEVANVSFVGNQKHNPGQPMHWAKEKSTDHADCIARHLFERGTIDPEDGLRHSAKVAWRALALLQIELEEEAKRQFTGAGQEEDEPQVTSTPRNAPGDRLKMERHTKLELDRIFGTNDHVDLHTSTQFSQHDLVAMDLVDLGCSPVVAKQIAAGTTFPPEHMVTHGWVYIAGPMRGKADFNFPAFDAARDKALEAGYIVISPADIDRAAKVALTPTTVANQLPFVIRDFWALHYLATKTPKGIIRLLPEWVHSEGAAGEAFLSRWMGLRVHDEQGLPAKWPDLVLRFAFAND